MELGRVRPVSYTHLEAGRKHIRWDEKWNAYRNQTGPVRKGVGMAIFCYKTGVHPISLETASARMVLNQDGSIQLCMGATEIGQGADTVFTQMASETTGISYDQVYIVSTQDTDTTPFDLSLIHIFRPFPCPQSSWDHLLKQ